MKKCGRPTKEQTLADNKTLIINALATIIETEGTQKLTVRKICNTAGVSIGTFYHHFQDKDDLLMYYVRTDSFDTLELIAPLSQPANRIIELYQPMLSKYQSLGVPFMKNFFATDNTSLCSYMGKASTPDTPHTALSRTTKEFNNIINAGYLPTLDTSILASDISIIVKGIIFEWCLTGGHLNMSQTLQRLISTYVNSLS